MSGKWLLLSTVSFLVFAEALAIGAVLPNIGTFWRGFLASVAPSALVLAVVIWLIEGPLLTQERRRRQVISHNARFVLQEMGEISAGMARELAEWLAGEFEPGIDLYGDERGDYSAFRPLLLAVYDQAKQVPYQDLPPYHSLTEDEFQRWIDNIQYFIDRIRGRFQGDLEVQATLLEAVVALDDLERQISRSQFYSMRRDQRMRYRSLGLIGHQLVNFDKAIDIVAPRTKSVLNRGRLDTAN